MEMTVFVAGQGKLEQETYRVINTSEANHSHRRR